MAPEAEGQLYNLRADPDEKINLFFEEEEKQQEMRQLLEQLKSSGRSAPLDRVPIGIKGIQALVEQRAR